MPGEQLDLSIQTEPGGRLPARLVPMQPSAGVEPFDAKKFFGRVGVAARVHERINMPGDSVQITLQGLRRFTIDDHLIATEGVECRKDAGVIDETPAAYKPIESVMAAQADLVEIVHTLKQVVCVKG